MRIKMLLILPFLFCLIGCTNIEEVQETPSKNESNKTSNYEAEKPHIISINTKEGNSVIDGLRYSNCWDTGDTDCELKNFDPNILIRFWGSNKGNFYHKIKKNDEISLFLSLNIQNKELPTTVDSYKVVLLTPREDEIEQIEIDM